MVTRIGDAVSLIIAARPAPTDRRRRSARGRGRPTTPGVADPDSGAGRPELDVGLRSPDRARCPPPAASEQVPLLLEDVAIGLDEVASGPDGLGDPGERRTVDVAQPAVAASSGSIDSPACHSSQAWYSFRSLRSSWAWPSRARILVRRSISRAWKRRVVTCIRRRTRSVAGRRVEGEVDRVAEIVEPADAGPDRLAVAGAEDRLVVELGPDRAGTARGPARRRRSPRRGRHASCIAARSARPKATFSTRISTSYSRWPSDSRAWISLVSASTR